MKTSMSSALGFLVACLSILGVVSMAVPHAVDARSLDAIGGKTGCCAKQHQTISSCQSMGATCTGSSGPFYYCKKGTEAQSCAYDAGKPCTGDFSTCNNFTNASGTLCP